MVNVKMVFEEVYGTNLSMEQFGLNEASWWTLLQMQMWCLEIVQV